MSYLTYTHKILGYVLVVALIVEVLWTFVETLSSSWWNRLSSIKSKIAVGLLDLQVLLGLFNAYLHWMIPYLHVAAMLGAVGCFHGANQRTGRPRLSLQGLGILLVILGIGVQHMT